MVDAPAPPRPEEWTEDDELSQRAYYHLLTVWERTGGTRDIVATKGGHIAIAVAAADIDMSAEKDANGGAIEQKYYFIEFTGTPGAGRDVVFTDLEATYFLWNNTNQILTMKTDTDTTGVAWAIGELNIIATESVTYDVRKLITIDASLGLTSAGVLQRAALTGEVTAGAGSNATVVNPGGAATVAVGDKILGQDIDNSDALVTFTAQSIADLAGASASITVADESSDTTSFPLFVTAATGDLAPKTNANLIFDASTGALGASTFVGAVNVLSVNMTAVGNVGVGEDDLMTYALPAGTFSAAGKGVRITAWGSAANNGNAKTLKVYFGSVIMTYSLTVSQAGTWDVDAMVFSTGTDTQQYKSKLLEKGAASGSDLEQSTLAEDDGATITIKLTGEATANDDILQEGMTVELFN